MAIHEIKENAITAAAATAMILALAACAGNETYRTANQIGESDLKPGSQVVFGLNTGEEGFGLDTVVALNVTSSYTICSHSAPGSLVSGVGFGIAIDTPNISTFSLQDCRLAIIGFELAGKSYSNPKVDNVALPLSLNGTASMSTAYPLLAAGKVLTFADKSNASATISLTIRAQPQWSFKNGTVSNQTLNSATYILPSGTISSSTSTDSNIVSKAFTFQVSGVGDPNPVAKPTPFVAVGFTNGVASVGSLNFPFTPSTSFVDADRWTFCYFAEGNIGSNVTVSSIKDIKWLKDNLPSLPEHNNATGEGVYCSDLPGGTANVTYSISIGRNDPLTRFPRSYSFVYFRRTSVDRTLPSLRKVDDTANIVHGLLHVKLQSL